MNYYNECEKKTAAWLRELIAADLIAPGEVDERSIEDVTANDLKGFTQCHFFAGIGGWSHALRLAGWPDDRPVWTGSCPCQPYSVAGQGKGDSDSRNLWPTFFRLIRECRPDVVFGEQVEAAIRHGWLDGLQADLERETYSVGHCVLGAHSVGWPHIRLRLYWAGKRLDHSEYGRSAVQKQWEKFRIGSANALADAESGRLGVGRSTSRQSGHTDECIETRSVAYANGWQSSNGELQRSRQHGQQQENSGTGGLGDTQCSAPARQRQHGGKVVSADEESKRSGNPGPGPEVTHLLCSDGKVRQIPIERAFFPLVTEFQPARVVCLRGAGNAIHTATGAQFIKAFKDVENDTDF